MKNPSRREFIRHVAVGASLASGPLAASGFSFASQSRSDPPYNMLIQGGHVGDPTTAVV